MTSRLVLGCGSLAGALIDTLSERRDDLAVLADDENAVQTLREEGVAAETGDPTDPGVFENRDRPDTVVVTTDDAATNLAAARAARTAFPDSFLFAYAGLGPDGETTTQLHEVADKVVDPTAETTAYLLDRIGETGVRTRKLASVLRDVEGTLAVVAHDNPDPDAIASAVALVRVADAVGCDAEVCYFGEISHQENRAFVNLLEFDLRNLDPGADLSEYGGVALVDHSRPGVNDGLPEDTAVDVVIDHHPPRYPVEARFVDLRSDVGATSTLLVDYLRQLGITPDREVATGLVFGIRVDTDEFTREVSPADFEATAYLQPHADLGMLERIESPSISAETLETVGRAISNREHHGTVLVSGVGELSDRDALAQAADRLLDLEGVNVTFVHGIREGTVYVSARARGTDVDLGETLRDAFGQIGSAGGHADMAGAQISLGVLDEIEAGDEALADVVDAVVAHRFLEAIESDTNRVLGNVYPDEFHGVTDLEGGDVDLGDLVDEWTDRGSGPDDEADATGTDETDATGTDEADATGTDDTDNTDEADDTDHPDSDDA